MFMAMLSSSPMITLKWSSSHLISNDNSALCPSQIIIQGASGIDAHFS
jgi:hypothetical protein